MHKLFVVCRADLAPGYQAAQSVHAAFDFACRFPETTCAWHPGTIVVLSVSCEADLRALLARAKHFKLECAWFHEPDLDDALTAIAIGPTWTARMLCAPLPLLLQEESLV